jgi:hypothetical protein
MKTLREKQSLFARMVPMLFSKAFSLGFEITVGDAFRDPRLYGEMGIKKGYGQASSCHKLRLAIDINLFKDGKYLGTIEAHTELGEYWESLGGSWGGRFEDGNHYSLEHEGHR